MLMLCHLYNCLDVLLFWKEEKNKINVCVGNVHYVEKIEQWKMGSNQANFLALRVDNSWSVLCSWS